MNFTCLSVEAVDHYVAGKKIPSLSFCISPDLPPVGDQRPVTQQTNEFTRKGQKLFEELQRTLRPLPGVLNIYQDDFATRVVVDGRNWPRRELRRALRGQSQELQRAFSGL